MKLVVLEYGDRQARWEATIDGCVVEIARQLGDDGQTLVDTRAFATPRLAREFIDDEVDRLIAAGFRERRPDAAAATPVPTPGDAVMQQVARMTPTACENPQLLARIRSDPGNVEPYLVYADWLQEHGDPRGYLIALQHAAHTNPPLHLAVKQLIDRFRDHVLPATTSRFFCEWHLGFLDTLECEGDDLLAFLSHPCTAVLRQLGCEVAPFVQLAGRVDLPCVRVLRLAGCTAEDASRLSLAGLPSLRILSLVDVEYDAMVPAIEQLAAQPAMASLRLLAAHTDYLEDDEDLQRMCEALLAMPREARPALHIDLGDPDWNQDLQQRLRREFELVDELPSSPLLSADRYEDDDTDLLDRLCDQCHAVVLSRDGQCEHCGAAIKIYDEDYGWAYEYEYEDVYAGDPGDGEVCTHDAARDPNFDPSGDADPGVDTRWDAFKDDAFDLDEA